jgi:hypothetical protein
MMITTGTGGSEGGEFTGEKSLVKASLGFVMENVGKIFENVESLFSS